MFNEVILVTQEKFLSNSVSDIISAESFSAKPKDVWANIFQAHMARVDLINRGWSYKQTQKIRHRPWRAPKVHFAYIRSIVSMVGVWGHWDALH